MNIKKLKTAKKLLEVMEKEPLIPELFPNAIVVVLREIVDAFDDDSSQSQKKTSSYELRRGSVLLDPP